MGEPGDGLPRFSMRLATETISHGKRGLDAKIKRIRELVEASKRDPKFRARVAEIIAGVAEKDHQGEIAAVFDFVRSRVRYMRDPWSPNGFELFTEPSFLMEQIGLGELAVGDCDDHVLLASAMLEVAGYRTRYRIGGRPPDQYQHIWLEVEVPRSGWMALDLTGKDKPMGWDPSSLFPLTLTYEANGASTMGLGDTYPALLNRRFLSKRHGMVPSRFAHAAQRQRSVGELAGPPTKVPPSFYNTVAANSRAPSYMDATPSDFMRACSIRQMLPEDFFGEGIMKSAPDGLAGFSLKKIAKTVTKPIEKTAKAISKPVEKLAAKAKPVLQKAGKTYVDIYKKAYDPLGPIGRKLYKGITKPAGKALKDLGKAFKAPKAPTDSGGTEPAPTGDPNQYYQTPTPYLYPMAPMTGYSSAPVDYGTEPADFSQDSGYWDGPVYEDGLDPYEVLTPETDEYLEPDQPWFSGAWGQGSYVMPDGSFPYETEPVFDETGGDGGSYFPGFGQGYGTEEVFYQPRTEESVDVFEQATGVPYRRRRNSWRGKNPAEAVIVQEEAPEPDMDNTQETLGSGTLGAESWIEELAKVGTNLVQEGGKTFLAYQQAKLASKQPSMMSQPAIAPPLPPQVIQRSGTPSWLLPAGIALAAVLLLRRR